MTWALCSDMKAGGGTEGVSLRALGLDFCLRALGPYS